MKTNKCLSILATLAVLFSLVPSASAMNPQNFRPNVSNFTPTEAEGRIGVNFIQDMLSFTYSTFNNFTYSEEGSVLSPSGAWNQGGIGSNKGDERRFLAGKHCDHLSNDNLTCLTANNQANNSYYNTVPTEFSEGDIVRFQIFFHNNGQDPYDGAGGTSPVAENVRIGIDLNNITDANDPEYLRPLGFIKSNDNEYRTNIVQDAQTGDIIRTGAVITNADGTPKSTATDDMEIKLTEAGMQLEPMPGHIFASLNGGNFRQFITEPTQVTYDVEDGPGNSKTFTANLTPHIDGNKIWLTFDKIPGCFRYSGWLVFDAVVVKPPKVCTSLDLAVQAADPINNQSAVELFVPNIDFNPDGIPNEAKLKWTAPEEGLFFTRNNGNYVALNGNVANGRKTVFTNKNQHVFYVNPLQNSAQTVNVAVVKGDNSDYSEDCKESVQVPPQQPNFCQELRANVQDPIQLQIANSNEVVEATPISVGANNIRYAPFNVIPLLTENGNPGVRLKWTTTDPDGKFRDQAGFLIGPGADTLTAIDKTVFYTGSGTVTVQLQERAADGWVDATCNTSIPFNAPPICAELKVDHHENIFEQTLSSFLALSIDTRNNNFNEGKIRYTVDEGFGSFFKIKPNLQPENQSPIIFETFDAAGILNVMRNLWVPGGAWDFNPQDGMASTLTAFIPSPRLGPDLSGVDLSGAIEPRQFDNPIDSPVDLGIQYPITESIEVNPGEQVWFFGEKASNGVNVIHIDQLDKNAKLIQACTRDFPIIPFSICDSLKVNHDAVIKEQKVTTFEAKALDTSDRNFKGMITYTVDEGHGRFFLVDPQLSNNNSQRITEFNINDPIEEPVGGFCGVGEAVLANDNNEINWDAAFSNNQNISSAAPVSPAVIVPVDTSAPTSTSAPSSIPASTPTYTIDLPDNTTIINGNEGTPSYTFTGSFNNYLSSDALLQLKPVEVIDLTTNLSTGNFFKTPTYDFKAPTYDGVINPKTFEFTSLENNVFNIQQLINQNQEDLLSPDRFQLNIQDLQDRFSIDAVDIAPDRSYQTVTVKPGTKVWFLAENDGENVIHVTTACTEVGGCKRDFSITPVQTVCKDFGMVVDPSTQLKVGENATIRLTPKDQNGNPLPGNTKIKVTNTAGGRVVPNQERIQNNFYTLDQFPATLENTQQTGKVTLSVDPTDPSFSLRCQGEITVTEEVAPECKALTYVLKEFFSGDQVDTLKENTFYQVNSNVDVIGENQAPSVVYSINQNYGAFVSIHNENPFRFVDAMAIKALADNDNLTRATLENLFGAANVNSVVTVSELETVYFTTFTSTPGASGLTANILEIKAKDFGNAECQKSVPLEKAMAEKECIDLEIVTPDSPWEIDENDDSQLFQIRVRTSPESYKDDLFYHWEVTDGNGEWRSGAGDLQRNIDDTLIASGDTTQTLENFDKNTEVEVYATDSRNGEKISTCSDSISATVREEKKKPKISKYVYPTNKVDDKDTIINIGETRNTPYVTYLVAFTPGDSKSVEIWEDSMSHDKIYSAGDLNGHLDLEEMSINILKDNERNSYAFMRSDRYDEDDGNSSYADENFDYNEDRKIFCNENGIGNNQLCIDNADDVEELMTKFGNGEKIRFKNVSSLDNGDQIIIKYRVHNYSVINNSSCENLSASNGCGEEFDNTIKFKAYEDNNFEDELENGRDSAKVIVICPYVITRGGGDTFFHDIIDTGADVAKCSEVKSCEGVCITPPRETKPRIPSTGAGTGDISKDLNLTLPSHDICKYSNNGDNIEGYNDVLKNFSSTVCEVESEVAAIWKEKNINESIAANIERIARFGSNLSGGELNTDNVDNKKSGVFISDNDITIGANGEYIIESGNGLPAAQTYIIRNADLYIKSDIRYGNTNFSDQTNIPSAAFIVIDGNIIIEDSVGHLDGIYMAVNLDGKNDDGKVTNAKDFNADNYSETPLSIYGNLIGNVYELFATRKGYGDPTKDEGSVVVHYDSRILLNTPPGISELVDVNQSLVPG